MLGVIGLAALTWVLVVWFRGVWRWRFTDSVAALASACVGYTVWVAFNFDWAPATGLFWLLAGAAWSGVRMAEARAASAAKAPPSWAAPARSLAAVGLAVAFIGLAVFPVLADVWYFQGRADLSVSADPLQSRYHWARGQELSGDGQTKEAAAEFRRAADLGETEPQLYVDLGDADAKLGDRAQARRDYERALLIDPFYAPAKQRLANLGA
jgi:tetratricopeptide (TPR) repeat protein